MSGFEVISPGLLTSIQDGGRQGHEHLGISPGGAADSVSLLLANRLVGNSAFEAALEMTLVGPTLRFACDAVIALTG
ncbi:MAG: allophanate hydrolase, partial [Bdellovibrionia bacterium]